MAERENEIKIAAEHERRVLREQAQSHHESNVEFEERRFSAELAHIDKVYRTRLGLES